MQLHEDAKPDLMKATPSKTVVRSWARLMKLQQSALAKAEDALKAAGFPPLSWYDVLLELERVGEAGMRPFELEAQMLLAQHNLSRLIDRMETAGYVERRECQDDGRGQMVMITSVGRNLRRRMWPVYADVIQRVIGSRISERQVKTLNEVLGVLLDLAAVK